MAATLAADGLPPRIALRRRARGTALLAPLAVPVVVLLVWQLVSTQSDLVPGVAETIEELVAGFREGWILEPLGDSMRAIALGFLLAAAVGLPVGVLLGTSRYLGSVFDPIVAAFFTVPRIILYPMLLAWFGVGQSSKLAMGFLSAFFPIVLATSAGLRDVNPTLVKLGKAMKCNPLQLVRKIYLPAAAGAVMVGVRLGLSVAFISVIIAELFAASQGLGLEVQRSYALQQLPRMYAVVLLIGLIALAANLLLLAIERRWRSATA